MMTLTTMKKTIANLFGKCSLLMTLMAFTGFLTVLVVSGGCVTVNVNFPESAVQRAADDFVRDLYNDGSKKKKPTTTKESSSYRFIAPTILDWIIPSAEAQELNVSSSKSQKIKARMRDRLPQIEKYKKAGVLGEARDAMLVLKKPAKVASSERDAVKELVKAENEDRNDLFEEIQDENKVKSRNTITGPFATAFQNNSPVNTWLEGQNGKWTQKRHGK